MPLYKTYARRRGSGKRGVWIWLGCILAVFAATACFGAYLGSRVRPAEPYTPPAPADARLEDKFTDLAGFKMHGAYFEPTENFAVDTDDPYAAASFWIFRGGAPTFALETDRLLGRDTKGLADLGRLKSGVSTSGLFEVGRLYAPEAVKAVYAAYEDAVLAEYTRSALGEIVLMFRQVRREDIDEMFAMAKKLSARVTVCVPYSILQSDLCRAFFTAADGFNVALDATGVKPKTLESDIDTYAFYFTKFNLRLVLTAKDAPLTKVLAGAGLLNYQLSTPGAADVAEEEPVLPEE